MRILITGGFGFLGGRLAVHLTQAGNKIIIGSRHLIAPPRWLPQVEVAKIAWNDDAELERCCKGVDVIIHAAGMNAQDCVKNPGKALEVNGKYTSNLALAAKRSGVKKFIYISTAHVYASQLAGKITEELRPCNIHPYATSNVAGEKSVLSASASGELQGIVIRLSNAFGAPSHKNVNCWMLLVNDLCKQAVENQKLLLQSNGLQYRDFIGLSEVCCVVEKIILSDQIKWSNIFNVGSGVSQTVLNMAELIQQRCGEVLGFFPELRLKESRMIEHSSAFNYSMDKLNFMGVFSQAQSNTKEIDNLLQFCKTSFGVTKN